MRLFEILIILLLVLRLLGRLLHRDIRLNALPITGLGALAVHLAVEGYRWQMLPLYLLTIAFGAYALWRIARFRGEPHRKQPASIPWTVVWLLLLGVACLPPALLPIPTTPAPGGPYPVGTLTLEFIDESREELYSGVVGQPRRFMVQIWYPAAPAQGAKPTIWLENVEQTAPTIATFLDLPDYFLDHIRYSKTHSYQGAPAASGGPFPLLLYSHGWNGFKNQATFQVEELASHGYVVVVLDHAYGAMFSIFPDGSLVVNNPQALPTGMGLSTEEFLLAANLLGRQWAGDLSFILDELAALQPGDPAGLLAGQLDFERIGALGHSTGGGAVIEFCGTDPRCQAALGMDPYMDPVSRGLLVESLPVPYLALFSELWANERSKNDAQFNPFFANLQATGASLYIQDTRHFDFTDLPAFSPLAPYLGLKGPLPGDLTLEIIQVYSLAFFDQALRGQPSDLLSGPAPDYPEVIWRAVK